MDIEQERLEATAAEPEATLPVVEPAPPVQPVEPPAAAEPDDEHRPPIGALYFGLLVLVGYALFWFYNYMIIVIQRGN